LNEPLFARDRVLLLVAQARIEEDARPVLLGHLHDSFRRCSLRHWMTRARAAFPRGDVRRFGGAG
jgi:hypothetical protein